MREPSGSVPPSSRLAKNKRAMYVFGTVSLSTTLMICLGFSDEKIPQPIARLSWPLLLPP